MHSRKVLNRNANIVFLPADKRNATVVMNVGDYQLKIRDLLDPVTYKENSKESDEMRKTTDL